MAGDQQRNVLPASAIEVRAPISTIADVDQDHFTTVQEAIEQIVERIVTTEEVAAGLGTAATRDTGTSAANVPTVAQADARYQGIGTTVAKTNAGAAGASSTFLTFQSSAAAAFTWVYDETNSFNSIYDPAFFFGYNVGAQGSRANSSFGSLHQGFEGRYNNSGYNSMEWYLNNIVIGAASYQRPIMFRCREDSLQVTGMISARTFQFLREDMTTEIATLTNSNVQLGSGVTFQMASGATANAARLTSSAATALDLAVNGRDSFHFYDAFNLGGALSINMVANEQSLSVASYAATQGVIVAKAFASQSAWIFAAWDSANTPLSGFDHKGYIVTKKTTVPLDADLVAGELALWFDPTNGAAKLMVKAKETGGTVRTGSLALA